MDYSQNKLKESSIFMSRKNCQSNALPLRDVGCLQVPGFAALGYGAGRVPRALGFELSTVVKAFRMPGLF